MDFVDHPVFNASDTPHNANRNTINQIYDKKMQEEKCEKLLRCIGNDKTLQKKYEEDCGSSIIHLRPDILWMA
tara:strand:- start:234 stop:452 length:219 start_codon:yes stop_codon:yes gene_type:complete